MCKISVVIPVYNVENTLFKCVNSVISQTFSDLEILLINDGSTDGSADVCAQLLEKDSRIKYFAFENNGLSFVRNYGIENACGEYICFVDSDDYLESDCLSFMYETAKNNLCDIVLCGYFKENKSSVTKIFKESQLLDQSNINSALPELKDKCLIDPAWNKLYSLSFLKSTGVLMPVGEFYEDTYFNLSLLPFNPKIFVSDRCFYHYILHSGSITRRYNKGKLETIKNRARLLKQNTCGIEAYCDYYFIKSVFSSITDMFLACKKTEIKDLIKSEISHPEFKAAAKGAKFGGKSAKIIIKTAQSDSVFTVFLFCKISCFFKYKMQRLFLKVVNR